MVKVLLAFLLLVLLFCGCDPEKPESSDPSSSIITYDDNFGFDESAIPDLNVSFPDFPDIPNEDNSGERGDTWRLPQWPDASLPFETGDLNIPNNPVNIVG